MMPSQRHLLSQAMSLALPTLCLVCSQAQAQSEPIATLPTVTVSGSKVNPLPAGAPLNKSTLSPKLATTSDTASLLTDVPGLSLNGAGGVSSLPAINGLADDRLRIKVDGMDLIASCPNHMNPASGVTALAAPSRQSRSRRSSRRPDKKPLSRARQAPSTAATTRPAVPTSLPATPPINSTSATAGPLPRPTTIRQAATSKPTTSPAAWATPWRAMRSAPPLMKRRTIRWGWRLKKTSICLKPSWAFRTCRFSSTRTSAWTCLTTSKTA